MAPFHTTPDVLNAAQQQPDAAQPALPDGSRAVEAPARRLSTQEGLIGQKLRSGTPHLHHFLQASPTVTTLARGLDENEGLNQWARISGARRYSSADLFLHGVKACARVDATSPGSELGDAEGEKDTAQRRSSSRQTDSRDSSLFSPTQQARPLLSVSTVPQSPSPLSKNHTIEESSCEEDAAEAAEGNGGEEGVVALQAPVYQEDPSLCTAGTASVAVSPKTAPVGVASLWCDEDAPKLVASPTQCLSSAASSVSSSPRSDASSDETADTEVTSPERSPDGDETPIARVAVDIDKTFKRASREPLRGRRRTRTSTGGGGGNGGGGGGDHADRYGTPEMPRGTAKLPHLPASGLTPRIPNSGHAKHLPRAEKLPMSGYELLASTISSSPTPPPSSSSPAAMMTTTPPLPPSRLSAFLGTQRYLSRRNSVASFMTSTSSSARSGPEEAEAGPGVGGGPDGVGSASLKPIYRRFEALNHRILLHMQDELSELEEQLHRLDTTDTQTRRMQSRILPASRRAEYLAGGELQWHKSDILGKIGVKLGQYNHVLSSFSATRDLPAPSPSDVNEYRSYLATHQPITEVETRFLDTVDDLVTLAAPKGGSSSSSSSSSAATAAGPKPTPTPSQEYPDPFRAHEDPVVVPPFPTVTPIPGTMHGNSWLMRHNRLPSMSERGGHARTQSQPTSTNPSRLPSRQPSFVGGSQLQRRMSTAVPPPRPEQQPPPPPGTPRPIGEKQPEPTGAQGPGPVDVVDDNNNNNNNNKQQTTTAAPVSPVAAANDPHVILHVVIAMAVAVLIPILAFSAVPGFVGRITVVSLVGLSAMGSVVQSSSSGGVASANNNNNNNNKKGGVHSNADVLCIAAVYAAVMAVVAGVIN